MHPNVASPTMIFQKKYVLEYGAFVGTEISGQISWVPTKHNPWEPTFFLNNGTVSKEECAKWTAETGAMFPTSDVCRMMCNNTYSGSSLFTTSGFCGKVDVVDVNECGSVVCSLEYPVGYVGFEITVTDKDGSGEAPMETRKSTRENLSQTSNEQDFLKVNSIEAGKFLFLKGDLPLEVPPHVLENNVYMRVNNKNVEITAISAEAFSQFVLKLLALDQQFNGIHPEAV